MPDDTLAMPLAALAAVVLDRLLGEPRRFHPLVGFGNLAGAVEKRFNRRSRLTGIAAWTLVVLPFVALAAVLRPHAAFAVDVALLYFALGARSLAEHAEAVA
ncbi:MAG: cobalamin biosynthesis protein, partial [Dechloromonas sp.]|nr:cobalamin biosynthesis protein [Dechloromonas sp.]